MIVQRSQVPNLFSLSCLHSRTFGKLCTSAHLNGPILTGQGHISKFWVLPQGAEADAHLFLEFIPVQAELINAAHFFGEALKSENENFSAEGSFPIHIINCFSIPPPHTHTFCSQFIMAIFQLFQATFFIPSFQSDRMTFPGCGAKCDCFDYDSLGDQPWSWPNAVWRFSCN